MMIFTAMLVVAALAQPSAPPSTTTTTTTTTAAPPATPREAECNNAMAACLVKRKFCADDNTEGGDAKQCACADKEYDCLRSIPLALECGSEAEFKARAYDNYRSFGEPCMKAEAPLMTPTASYGRGPTWGRSWDDTNKWDTFTPELAGWSGDDDQACDKADADVFVKCGEQLAKCASDAAADLDAACACYGAYVRCIDYVACDAAADAKKALCDASRQAFDRDCCYEDASPNRGGDVGAMVAAVVIISVLLAIALIWWGMRLNKTETFSF